MTATDTPANTSADTSPDTAADTPDIAEDALRSTPLTALHEARGAKLVPFAGYRMPVQYPDGIVAEHLHTRQAAGLFDVSHMGQAWLHAGEMDAATALERLVPGDLQALKPGAMRYTLLLNDAGGVVDDLIVTRPAEPAWQDRLFLVFNAARKDVDTAYITDALGAAARLESLPARALIALQGPQAAAALAPHAPGCGDLAFMTGRRMTVAGADALVTRSGYTGEDGFEISVPADAAEAVAEALLAAPAVAPVGLGARDTLRLEAGLCLYGHELDETTTPVAAGLVWTLGKRRRDAGDFPGAARILADLRDGPAQRRVGLRPEGKAPVRDGAMLHLSHGESEAGIVTSGGYGPSVGAPVAMGYVNADLAADGTRLDAMVRGKARPVRVARLPFVTPGRKPAA